LIEDVGFDGFRYDCVKGRRLDGAGYPGTKGPMTQAVQTAWRRRVLDSTGVISEWLDEMNAWSDNPAGAF
jgi:hypothetical protein